MLQFKAEKQLEKKRQFQAKRQKNWQKCTQVVYYEEDEDTEGEVIVQNMEISGNNDTKPYFVEGLKMASSSKL